MKEQDFNILKSKLKRGNVGVSLENDVLIFGKAKADNFTMIFMIILPIAILFISGIVLMTTIGEIPLFKPFGLIAVILVGIIIQGIRKINATNENSSSKTTFAKNQVLISTETGEIQIEDFSSSNIFVHVKELDKEQYVGKLILIDKNEIEHPIFVLVDAKQQHVEKDLNWIRTALRNHVAI